MGNGDSKDAYSKRQAENMKKMKADRAAKEAEEAEA